MTRAPSVVQTNLADKLADVLSGIRDESLSPEQLAGEFGKFVDLFKQELTRLHKSLELAAERIREKPDVHEEDVIRIPAHRGFTIAQAAKYLGMHPQTLRDKSDVGEIPCRRVANRRLFLFEDLQARLESQRRG